MTQEGSTLMWERMSRTVTVDDCEDELGGRGQGLMEGRGGVRRGGCETGTRWKSPPPCQGFFCRFWVMSLQMTKHLAKHIPGLKLNPSTSS